MLPEKRLVISSQRRVHQNSIRLVDPKICNWNSVIRFRFRLEEVPQRFEVERVDPVGHDGREACQVDPVLLHRLVAAPRGLAFDGRRKNGRQTQNCNLMEKHFQVKLNKEVVQGVK